MRITECARGTWNRAEFWHGRLIATGAECHHVYALSFCNTLCLLCQPNITSASNIFNAANK